MQLYGLSVNGAVLLVVGIEEREADRRDCDRAGLKGDEGFTKCELCAQPTSDQLGDLLGLLAVPAHRVGELQVDLCATQPPTSGQAHNQGDGLTGCQAVTIDARSERKAAYCTAEAGWSAFLR